MGTLAGLIFQSQEDELEILKNAVVSKNIKNTKISLIRYSASNENAVTWSFIKVDGNGKVINKTGKTLKRRRIFLVGDDWVTEKHLKDGMVTTKITAQAKLTPSLVKIIGLGSFLVDLDKNVHEIGDLLLKTAPLTTPTTPTTTTKVHVVFDFDCTITCKHVFFSLHSDGSQHRSEMLSSIFTRGKSLDYDSVCKIWNLDSSKFTASLETATTLLEYFFDGNRKALLMKLLNHLREKECILHISTKGKICDVREILTGVKLIHYFQYIDGYNVAYNQKLLYNVQEERYETVDNEERYSSEEDMITSHYPMMGYRTKQEFIMGIQGRFAPATVVYVDDDKEIYKALELKKVICIDIGNKEQFYTDSKCNLDVSKVDAILEKIGQIQLAIHK